jgi:hypothetical protein
MSAPRKRASERNKRGVANVEVHFDIPDIHRDTA